LAVRERCDLLTVVKKYLLPDLIQIVLGVLVMVLLLFLGAISRPVVALLCFLGTAVVYHTWFNHLIRFIQRVSNVELDPDEDDEDDDIFPSA